MLGSAPRPAADCGLTSAECHEIASRLLQEDPASTVVCVLSKAQGRPNPRARVFAIVLNGRLRRARYEVEGRALECIAAPEGYFRQEISRGTQHHLLRALSQSTTVYGDSNVGGRLVFTATRRLAGRPPVVDDVVLEAMRSQALDLLTEFECNIELELAHAAAVTLCSLVRASVDYFFASNRIWCCSSSETVSTISRHSEAAGNALRDMLSAQINERVDAKQVYSAALSLCGIRAQERNHDQPPPLASPVPAPIVSSRMVAATSAIRSYRRHATGKGEYGTTATA